MALSDFLKKVPKAPPAPKPIDFEKEQAAAIRENLVNLPLAEQLASGINRLNVEQFNKAAEQMLPGYANIRDTITRNITSGLAGELPPGVERSLRQRAAEEGIALGTSGSRFDTMRNLLATGREQLAYAQANIEAGSRWLAAARAPTFDVSSLMFSPQERVAIRFQEGIMKFNRQWLRNQLKAIPTGARAAAIGTIDFIENAAYTAIAAYAGAKGSGGGGGGDGGNNSSSRSRRSNSSQYNWRPEEYTPVFYGHGGG